MNQVQQQRLQMAHHLPSSKHYFYVDDDAHPEDQEAAGSVALSDWPPPRTAAIARVVGGTTCVKAAYMHDRADLAAGRTVGAACGGLGLTGIDVRDEEGAETRYTMTDLKHDVRVGLVHIVGHTYAFQKDATPGAEETLMLTRGGKGKERAKANAWFASAHGPSGDGTFSCELCAEDNVGAEQWFTIDPCQHGMCTSCIGRLAANGAEMFHCPYCKGGIRNYTGTVARAAPAWAKDSALIMQDDTTDTAVCYVCRESGFLLVCDGDGCNNAAHHK